MKKQWMFVGLTALFFAGVGFFIGMKKQQQGGMASSPGESIQEAFINREPTQVEGDDVSKLNDFIYSMVKTSDGKSNVDDQLKKIIEYANDEKHKDSNPAKIYAGLAETAKCFKGIAWRLRDIVENADAAYIQAITGLRAIKRNNYRRGIHVDALFDYFVDPNPGEPVCGQNDYFKSVAELQDWLVGSVAPITKRHIGVLTKMFNDSPKNEPLFYVDMNLVYGKNTDMASKTQRYLKFMPGHLAAVIANVEERMGFTYYLASYDLEKTSRFLNTLLTQSFFAKKSDFKRGIISKVFDIHLQSPKQVYETLQNGEFKNSTFLTLRPIAKEKNYLGEALRALRTAATTRIEAYKQMVALAKLGDQERYVINPDTIASRNILTLAVLQKRSDLLNADGEVPFNDRVINYNFPLKISALFDVKNEKIYDLKLFYPDRFLDVREKNGSNPKTFKWNYEYGTAVRWPDPKFGGLLPGTENGAQFKHKLKSISRDASVVALQDWLRLFY